MITRWDANCSGMKAVNFREPFRATKKCFKIEAERRKPSGFTKVDYTTKLPEGLRPAATTTISNFKTLTNYNRPLNNIAVKIPEPASEKTSPCNGLSF